MEFRVKTCIKSMIVAATAVFIAGIVPARAASPVNSNATPAAKAVLDYLAELSSSSNKKAIVGQNLGHGTEISYQYNQLVEELKNRTGKYVGMIGLDYEYTERFSVADLKSANYRLIEYWNSGGLITLNWAPLNPFNDQGPYNCTNVNLTSLVDTTSTVGKKWLREIARIAAGLGDLQDNGVVVLWRPFQEMNGSWFWWGTKNHGNNSDRFRTLWERLYRRLTDIHGLNNLLWVYSPNSGDDFSTYPGSQYVDVVAPTCYDEQLEFSGYTKLSSFGKPMGVGEWGRNIGHASTSNNSGSFDNRKYIDKIAYQYDKVGYWVCWQDWTDNGKNVFMSLVNNNHASNCMSDSRVLTRDEVDWQGVGSFSAPQILTHPAAVTVDLEDSVEFAVHVKGSFPLAYRWQRYSEGEWNDIFGASSPIYRFVAREQYHRSRYRCKVSNAAGESFSNEARLSIRGVSSVENAAAAAFRGSAPRMVVRGETITVTWQGVAGKAAIARWYTPRGALIQASVLRRNGDRYTARLDRRSLNAGAGGYVCILESNQQITAVRFTLTD